MTYTVNGEHYEIRFQVTEHAAFLESGWFGQIKLLRSPLFAAQLKHIPTGELREITAETHWQLIHAEDNTCWIRLTLCNPEGIDQLLFVLEGSKAPDGIAWRVEVINDNPQWSVMSVSYPAPRMHAEYFDFFIPMTCGRVIKNAGKRGYYRNSDDEFLIRMHYFAVYGDTDGIYLGMEDPDSAVKRYIMEAKEDIARVQVDFFGLDAGKPANSFRVYGVSNWRYFSGDWYDATMLYKAFVQTKANWLPEIDENGRPDTPECFKEIPFWVYDYIPNTPYQRDNRPRSLDPSQEAKPEDYWYASVIALQKALDVPIAYHVYNWHHIPFNVEYPHFMPEKPGFREGAEKLQAHGIYVLPYINSVSWEGRDFESGHEVNFENTGKYGAGMKADGSYWVFPYPQTTISGHPAMLTQMCPTFVPWHDIICDVVRKMEAELPVDGIYFDQIAACIGRPCYNPEHRHTTGGGSYWVDGYNRLMARIRARKPANSFYFTECNTEGYMKYFDGFLTWMWVASEDVPAFPVIYAGYIQMLGRITDGKKKADKPFFKYQTAKSLLYGQQLGWCNADVLQDPERFPFLKQLVQLRYRFRNLFNRGNLLRPPKVVTDLKPVIASPALKFTSDLHMEQVLAGAWQYKDGSGLVIFLVNVSNEPGSYRMTFRAGEYGIRDSALPEDLRIEGNLCCAEGTLQPNFCKFWELS